MVSSHASLSYEQIADARISPSQPLFFQLYKQRAPQAEERIREAERLGYNAIFLTVDAPIAGHRELDVHAPFVLEAQEREAARARGEGTAPDAPDAPQDLPAEDDKGLGTAGALLNSADPDMSWEEVSSLSS